MKSIVIIMTFFFASFLSAREYGWTDISGNISLDSDNYGFFDVFFIDDNEGWIAPFGYYRNGDEINGIYHTTDGGETFELIPTDGQVNAIHFLGSQIGYIGMQEERVYYTSDGGTTWNLLFPLIGAPVLDIDFPEDGTSGFCCAMNTTINIISPEGIEKIESSYSTEQSGISCISENEAWSVGGDITIHVKDKEVVYDQGGGNGTFNSIQIFEDRTGWSCGSGDVTQANHGALVKTEDGKIWKDVLLLGERTTFTTLHFLSKEIGWVAGYNGIIIHTTDGGQNWMIDSSFTTDDFRLFWEKIFFTSENNGYVVGAIHEDGNYGRIYKYTSTNDVKEYIGSGNITLSPNPANEYIEINLSDNFNALETSAIEIYNVLGEKAYTQSIHPMTASHRMNISGLQPGVYILHYTNKSEIFVKE